MLHETNLSAYDRILDLLEGVKRNGTKATARCPAHPDSNPSLSITKIEGQALVHCHAGCDWRGVLAAIELSAPDLYDDGNGATYLNWDGRRVRRTYDTNGKKRFYQDGHINGAPTTLYRLDKVNEARRTTSRSRWSKAKKTYMQSNRWEQSPPAHPWVQATSTRQT